VVSRYGQPANALTARPGAQVNDPRRNALLAYKQGAPANALTAAPAQNAQPPSAPPPLPPNPNPQGGAIASGTGPTLNAPPAKGSVSPPTSARDRAVDSVRGKVNPLAPGGGGSGGPPPPDPFGGYDDLVTQQELLEQQRAVEERKLQGEKAAALQEARARMNLAGAGLSGLGAANESRIASDQNAGRIDALSAYDANARASLRDTAADQRDELRADVEKWDYEQTALEDIDGDGFYGNPKNPDNAIDSFDTATEFDAALTNNQGVDLDTSWFDGENADALPGSEAVPFSLTSAQLSQAQAAGHNLQKVKNVTTGNALGMRTYTLYKDEEGRFYVVEQG